MLTAGHDSVSGEAATIWASACKHLEQVLSGDVYDRWIAQITPRSTGGNQLVLEVANDFYQTWLEENYVPLIREALSASGHPALDLRFVVDHSHAPAPPPREKKKHNPEKQTGPRPAPGSRLNLNPKYTFDTFVVGPANHFAHAAALAVADSPARAYNPLFIYGGVGLGKTHLMQAIGHLVLSRRRAAIAYLSCEAFTNEYIDALQHKELVAFRRKYRHTDMLLIDDIHFLAGKERMQEEFFHTFNVLFDNHRQIVLASDRPASEIQGLEHRLVSRFEWGLVTELEVPDFETRVAILRKKREEFQLQLTDEALAFMAERIRSNIRRLEGALIRAASYHSLTGRPLTNEQLEYLLRDTLDQEQQSALTIEKIQRAVAEYYDIRLGDMTSKRRPQVVAFPRQVAMYLCRAHTSHSLPAIGNGFGRNHATVLHAVRKVTGQMESDESLRRAVLSLSQGLGCSRPVQKPVGADGTTCV